VQDRQYSRHQGASCRDRIHFREEKKFPNENESHKWFVFMRTICTNRLAASVLLHANSSYFSQIMIKLPSSKSAIFAFALVFATAAHALTITPTTGVLVGTGDDNSNLSPTQIGSAHSLGSLFLLYKSEVGGSDSGTFANSYNTTFTATPNDPSGAIIAYVGAPAPVPSANPLYLYVKDGNADPAYYVFNISLWDGVENLVLEGFWPQQGAISNLQILGGTTTGEVPPRGGPAVGVPDGGNPVALLGLGLAIVALLRRKISI